MFYGTLCTPGTACHQLHARRAQHSADTEDGLRHQLHAVCTWHSARLFRGPAQCCLYAPYTFVCRVHPRHIGSFSFCLFFCLLLKNPKILTLPPTLGSQNPWECIRSGRVALLAVIPKVHHHPETLYLPIGENTPQVDGLARTHGVWTYASPARILSHRIAFRNPLRLTPLSTNTQGSLTVLKNKVP